MPRKFKKIKGGFDIDKIKDVDAFNNLQSLVKLKTLEVLDSDDYFLDEKGDILEDIIIAEKIKYENAF